MKLSAWVFLPTQVDLETEWEAPQDYVRASVGELRLKPSSDTPMTDSAYEPGWKRVNLDTTILDMDGAKSAYGRRT